MDISLKLLLLSSGTTFCFGIGLFQKLRNIKNYKNNSTELSRLISDGLKMFGFRSLSSMLQIILYVTLVLMLFSVILSKPFYWKQVLCFFLGGLVMAVSLYIIIGIIPKMIPKIINNSNGYLKKGIHTQFNIITMLGFLLISVIIIGFSLCYYFAGLNCTVGYTLGIILSSFFLRIGGGLYKVGADISLIQSKNINQKISSNPASNPGILLDIAGDFTGKLIGFCSDIIGSFILCIVALLIMTDALHNSNIISTINFNELIQLPFYILSLSFISTWISYLICSFQINQNKYQNFLLEGLYISLIICGAGTYFLTKNLSALPFTEPSIWIGASTFKLFYAYIAGLIGAILISFTSEILTSQKYKSAKNLASYAEYGFISPLLKSLSIGLRSNTFYLIYFIIICYISYNSSGFYGICIASLGMLSTTLTITCINSFSPLSSATNKIALLSNVKESIIKNTTKMDDIGKTTVAIGGGFATITSLITTLSLLLSTILLTNNNVSLFAINLEWLIGILSGFTIPTISAGFLLNELVKIALSNVKEIKKQYQTIPFLNDGKGKPDIEKASDQHACKSMDALIIPGILMALIPIIIGYIVNPRILISFALGTFFSGFIQSFTWTNAGDISTNAKHYIQKGHFGGKSSIAYQQILPTDQLGDAFKDLLSPSMNIFIKSVMILAVVLLLFAN